METCRCGQWPIEEYGSVCPSCIDEEREFITNAIGTAFLEMRFDTKAMRGDAHRLGVVYTWRDPDRGYFADVRFVSLADSRRELRYAYYEADLEDTRVRLDATEPGELLRAVTSAWVRVVEEQGPSGHPVVEIRGTRQEVIDFVDLNWDAANLDIPFTELVVRKDAEHA